MNQIQAVVFDIGQVLIKWQPERFYDGVIGEVARKQLFADIDLHAINEEVDLGAPLHETLYAHAKKHPKHAENIRLWSDRWIDMASPAIDWSVTLKANLQANGIPVLALSNFGIDTFAHAQSVYPFLNNFDQMYVSGHLGHVKPHTEIYTLLENGCGFAPETLLFVDDRPENIETARSRGWHGHVFTNPKGWAERLVSEGLLTPAQALLED